MDGLATSRHISRHLAVGAVYECKTETWVWKRSTTLYARFTFRSLISLTGSPSRFPSTRLCSHHLYRISCIRCVSSAHPLIPILQFLIMLSVSHLFLISALLSLQKENLVVRFYLSLPSSSCSFRYSTVCSFFLCPLLYRHVIACCLKTGETCNELLSPFLVLVLMVISAYCAGLFVSVYWFVYPSFLSTLHFSHPIEIKNTNRYECVWHYFSFFFFLHASYMCCNLSQGTHLSVCPLR